MADRNRNYRQPYQGQQRNGDYRQPQQFEPHSYGSDRGNQQMGEDYGRDDYGQADHDYDAHASESARRHDYGQDRAYGSGPRGGGRGRYSVIGETEPSGGYGPAHVTNREGRGFSDFTSNDFGGRDFAAPRTNNGYGRNPDTPYGPYGAGGYGAGSYGAAPRRDYGGGDDRGFFERAGDAVSNWFSGDSDDGRDNHRGRGPTDYTRSDERILEDACDRLTDDWAVDASDMRVSVQGGEVTLDGTVSTRHQKRRAEDCVDSISGVSHVQNNLRVKNRNADGERTTGTLS
ncbi:BON domain-containing protein [Altererythrobacter sp. B11]|uniref:BON domain-containing protein n=1 Tax=Altererythrobacter sp. B11 TaxID=2060312 RepID=UPI000DC71527|nr:BON domain-containing protein [Altererythrobacter sp. B11]BBC71555.1 BON domain-containing protein [Altererythrobacter sp. B11]